MGRSGDAITQGELQKNADGYTLLFRSRDCRIMWMHKENEAYRLYVSNSLFGEKVNVGNPFRTVDGIRTHARDISHILGFRPSDEYVTENPKLPSNRIDLFETEGVLQIQKCDEFAEVGYTDHDALCDVIDAALQGDMDALRALYLDGRPTHDHRLDWWYRHQES